MDRRWDNGPHIDSTGEPWRATFPGLGTVLVDDAGDLTIEPDQPGEQVEAALRWGWGEALSLARRDYLLLTGSTVVTPDRERALLMVGDTHDVAILLLALASQGWAALADRVTPFRWDDDRLVAHPRQAPVVVSRRRARKAGWEGADIRQESDAVSVAVTRYTEPVPLGGIVQLRSAKSSEPIEQTRLAGMARLEGGATLRAPGVLSGRAGGEETPPDDDPDSVRRMRAGEAMQSDLRLAQAAPILRLGFDSDRQDEVLDVLLQWFAEETS